MWSRRMRQAALIGGVVGLALFYAMYTVFGSPAYALFIIFGAAIAAGTVWVMDNPPVD
ncbi:hypothetical protein PAA26_03570 [Methanomassiliicoccaceae archaeon COG_1]|nr:hypothetical protein [Methanomassiliicoccaceae archaeon COG_1]